MQDREGNVVDRFEPTTDMDIVEEIETELGDIKCGHRPTSCSGQLAIAVRQAYDGILEPGD